MACSVKQLVLIGIFLAILDILHGLATLLFYGYYFIVYHFYLCPTDLMLTECRNKLYIYDQGYALRTYIGIGEGGIAFIFDIIYIIALSKHISWLMWFWLLKSVAVIGINVFYVGKWIVRAGTFNLITNKPEDFQLTFPRAGEVLTIIQVIIMILFCVVGAFFSSKVSKERSHSRVSLHRNSRIRNVLALGPERHPRETNEDEDSSGGSFEGNKRGSHLMSHSHNGNLDQMVEMEDFRHPNNHFSQADIVRQHDDY